MDVVGHVRLLALTGIAFAVAALVACGADSQSYVERNEGILETLPEIPGAQRLNVQSSPYYEDDRTIPIGYTTNVTYEVPADMTAQEVVDFYVQSLKDRWEYCLQDLPTIDLESGEEIGDTLQAAFMLGGASVFVMTHGMEGGPPHVFEISVDHRATTDLCTGEDIR